MVSYDGSFANKTPLVGSPYWLILSNTTAGAEMPTPISIALGTAGNVLPVFGSEEDALYFMESARDRGPEPLMEMRWREDHLEVVRSGRARLAMSLHTMLKDIDVVAFDPLPPPDFVETVRAASMSREAFADVLLGRGRQWSQRSFGGRPRYRGRGASRI